MRIRNFEDFAEFDADGKLVAAATGKLNLDAINWDSISSSLGEISATPTPYPGSLSGTEEGDILTFDLVAGQTYTFAYRGTLAGGIVDPYMFLYGPGGISEASYITEDDDGGFGRSSMITVTAAATGTYSLFLTSFYTVDGADPSVDTGDYTLNVWSPEADVPGSTNVLGSLPAAVAIGVGTTFGNIDAAGDNDYFKLDLTAGLVYSFNFSGGVAGGAELGEPGGAVAQLRLYNESGTLLGSNLNFESGVGYFAQTDQTIYVRLSGYQTTTGGYTLDVGEINPADKDPLDAIRWKSANNAPTVDVNGQKVAYVYFAAASEGGLGETESTDDFPPGTPITTYGWEQHQIDAVMSALGEYTPITGITYIRTNDISQATFRLVTTINDDYGARFYPQDPASGAKQGLGIFNLASGGFGTDPNSLLPGGFSSGVILHEFGHAHGLAHPHDTGGGSDIMLGVTASTGSYGIYNLNQGVYTVMSYNDGWPLDPDGQRTYSAATRGSGWSETLGAFDIAVLQERYGVYANNTGNNTYTIADVQADSQYRTIWDTGGNDTIAYVGTKNAQIDLLAATLDYSPTGGGVVSFAHGVFGGFTIANGVIIENATGGSGNDVLLGNSAANVLTGNGGNDTMMGREGSDTASYANAAAGVTVDLGTGTATGGDGNDTLDSIENVIGSAYDDSLTGSAVANIISAGGGIDTVRAGNGIDVVTLGGGNDIFVAENGTKSSTKTGSWSWDVLTDFDGAGDDRIDLSGFGESLHFIGTNANKKAGDVSYKVYDSINGAEKALGIDIDGQPGASGVGGKVTVVYVNHDGGSPDVGIILLNQGSVDASDFIF